MELSDRRSGAVQVGEFIKIYARDRPGKSEKKVIEPLPSFVFNISSILYSACFMDIPGILIHFLITSLIFIEDLPDISTFAL